MKQSTLATIKKELAKFQPVYETLSRHWNGPFASYPHTTVISVLLQNAAFSGVGCHGYSHEKEVESMFEISYLLFKLNNYHRDDYMVGYAFNEFRCIFDGHRMSEEG